MGAQSTCMRWRADLNSVVRSLSESSICAVAPSTIAVWKSYTICNSLRALPQAWGHWHMKAFP